MNKRTQLSVRRLCGGWQTKSNTTTCEDRRYDCYKMRVKILFVGSSGHDQSGVRLKENNTNNNKTSLSLGQRLIHYFEYIYLRVGKKRIIVLE